MQIPSHTFLITGGSSGLGAACARLLASLGANVVIADLNEPAGERVAGELGASARFAKTDVTDEAQVSAAIEVAVSSFGRLDGAVSCAGILGAARIVGKSRPHDLQLFSRIVQVNLIGTFNVLRLAAAAMAANPPAADGERGIVINTSSVAAFEGQIGQAAYAASKGGVASLTLPAARELARFGIRVMAIAPGMFDTAMMSAAPDEVRSSLIDRIPFPSRPGRPEEFASLVREIIENRFLNGSVIRLDGALRMAAK
ncbi:MAG TPA: SDR family NAD(P)-dependent oxidoreductase [Pirellulales bacterium]|jgi:NAD(P)-dependent dehydrogenase (short-subunit alcohol dehydrogenase family)|nr:SDR family NAD(P)-dependent oxidoreductase [Pirellulales bacterium]